MKKLFLSSCVVLWICGLALAGEGNDDLWSRQNLSGGLFGAQENLEEQGIDIEFGITNIYQINLNGGTSTHRRKGRWSGSYDLELTADLDHLFDIEGAGFFVHAEGSWSRADLDESSIGSYFGANADFAGRRSMDIMEYYWEQSLYDGTVQFRLGKIDLAGGFECRGRPVSFDGNMYANDELTQFLNGAFKNNPTIPFPENGMAAIVHWNPLDEWYLSFGAADTQADVRETGFNTAFHDEDYFIYLAETGITPRIDSANGLLPGAYRAGVWYSPEPRPAEPDNFNEPAKSYRDDTGLYLSFDQKLTKEKDDPEDSQGLGGFFRYGFAHSRSNDIQNFFSIGFQYQGLLDGKDNDVAGLGYAQGIFSDRANATYTEDYESVVEVYYNAQVTGWMNLSPSLQYIKNPGGDRDTPDAFLMGMRAQIVF